MKLQVLQENLAQALSNASRFANPRAQLPILGNILLSAQKTKLQIAATNLEISLVVTIGAKVVNDGEIAIPAKTITEVITNLPPGSIELEGEKEHLKIESANFSSVVLGLNTSDFPKLPATVDTKSAVLLSQVLFGGALAKVLFAVSVDETRPILTGVLCLFHKDGLTLVATDGFRLSQKKIKLEKDAADLEKETKQLILPKSVLLEVMRLSQAKEKIYLNYKKSENQVLFGDGDLVLSSRILEGEFPDYQKIIPKTTNLTVTLDKEEMVRAVKLAAVFARDSANIVKLNFSEDALTISAESQSSGRQKTKIDAKIVGRGMEIAFNYRFLEDFLHSVESDEIVIELSDPNAPGIFRDPSDPDFLHLIMPVKIQS